MGDLLGLRGRVAMVVSAGRGMGRSSALLRTRVGRHVALVDIDDPQVKALAEEVRAVGREAIALHTDVTVSEDAEGTAKPDTETMARLAEPDDIGGAVLMLSSALARKITGQALVVDVGSSTASPFGRR